MNRIHLRLVVIATAALFVSGRLLLADGISHLAPADRAHMLDDDFRLVVHVAELPAAVLTAFSEHTKDSNFRMADPGNDFQVTDVILKPDLPMRRLVFAGVSSGYCLVHYESGGIAHQWWVVLFKLSSAKSATPVWDAACVKWGGFKSLAELRRALREGKLNDDPRLSW